MPSLKNPQLQIPGGYQFYVPETKWAPAPFSSLDSIVQQLIQHRKGQPYLTAKNGWSVDPAEVLREVTEYNVAVCVRMGWNDYLLGGSEAIVPFQPTPPRRRVRNLAAGAETLIKWIDEGAPTVGQELANKRAATCAEMFKDNPWKDKDGVEQICCPLNGKGGLESYFTVPVTNAIRAQLERKRKLKLETPGDAHLGVCEGCDCPLSLKVWLPMDNILKKMSAETMARLDPRCWILKRDA